MTKLFDKYGNCKTLGDPFRDNSDAKRLIFDDDGDVRHEAMMWIDDFTKKNKTIDFDSDIVKISE